MFSFILRRVLWIIPVLVAVGLVTFGIMRAAPGGPFDRDPNRRGMPAAAQRRIEQKFGLNLPVWRQFTRYMFVDRELDLKTGKQTWVCGAICGNLGPSFASRGARTVDDILFKKQGTRPSRFFYSARLGLQGLALAVVVGIPLGVIAALRQNSLIDYISLFISTIFTVLPSLIVGLLMVLFAQRVLNKWDWWTGLFGIFEVFPKKWDTFRPWVLPTLAIGFGSMAFITRLTRASVLEVIRQDYVRTARAKGLASSTVILRHVLKNSLIPVVTILGPALAGLLTGALFIETIFNVPGMARELVKAIGTRDYSMIMGGGLFYAFLIAFANLSVDLVYGFLDPRISIGK